jgi:hypothetical protein
MKIERHKHFEKDLKKIPEDQVLKILTVIKSWEEESWTASMATSTWTASKSSRAGTIMPVFFPKDLPTWANTQQGEHTGSPLRWNIIDNGNHSNDNVGANLCVRPAVCSPCCVSVTPMSVY